jgi:uncharacterized protein YutE (UPF0331/DUF86 family)
MAPAARNVDVARWRREIAAHLADFSRQYRALESAMAAFGEDFKLAPFKSAYETATDIEAYNRAQVVERALGRVQNYVADLSIAGVKLAGLDPPDSSHEPAAQRAFTALAEAGVVSRALCRRLKRAQRARTVIEHGYVDVPASSVHAAAVLVHEGAREFIASYESWIHDYL